MTGGGRAGAGGGNRTPDIQLANGTLKQLISVTCGFFGSLARAHVWCAMDGMRCRWGQGVNGRPQVLEHLGPYNGHAPVAAFGSISDRAFALYREATGGHEREGETPTQHLITRMIYVAEATSLALRLNASWALSHPALSLLRDRYEQVVRFSWLAKQDDNEQMRRYVAAYLAKEVKLRKLLPKRAKEELEKMGWTSDSIKEFSKDELNILNQWNSLDLKSMVEKRDKLTPVSDCEVGRETLSSLYVSIYTQFSSVTHYDMYSMGILGLHKAPNGQLVLAADPHFPSIINLHNSLFDIIQCYEVTRRFLGKDFDGRYSTLLMEWRTYVDRVIGRSASDATKDQSGR